MKKSNRLPRKNNRMKTKLETSKVEIYKKICYIHAYFK